VAATHLRHGFEEGLAAKVDWYLEPPRAGSGGSEALTRGRGDALGGRVVGKALTS